jgi:hypothetical protein
MATVEPFFADSQQASRTGEKAPLKQHATNPPNGAAGAMTKREEAAVEGGSESQTGETPAMREENVGQVAVAEMPMSPTEAEEVWHEDAGPVPGTGHLEEEAPPPSYPAGRSRRSKPQY